MGSSHPLEEYIGKPTDTTPFDLAAVPLALIGLTEDDGEGKLAEISAYAAFGEVVSGNRLNVEVSKKVTLHGAQGQTFRGALYKCYSLMHDGIHGGGVLLTPEERGVVCALTKQQPAAADMSFGERVRSSLLAARPFFAGTAMGTKTWAAQHLHAYPKLTAAWNIVDEFGRSFGNLLWICNPIAGWFTFAAILLEDRWQALASTWAVLVSSIFCRAIGASVGLLNLGLVQFVCVINAQKIAYNHQDTPPQDESWDAHKVAKGLVLITLSAVFTSILVLVFNTLFIPRMGMPPMSLFAAFSNLALLGLGGTSEIFDLQGASTFPTTFTVSTKVSDPSAWLPPGIDYAKVARQATRGLELCSTDLSTTTSSGPPPPPAHPPTATDRDPPPRRGIFTSAGDAVWCYKTVPNVLIWIGFYLASPFQAFTYLSGAAVGQFAGIFLGLPASVINGGFGLCDYGTCTQVIGGLLFVPSLTSYFLGLLAAVFNMVLFHSLKIIFSQLGFGALAGSWAHSFTAITFMAFKYLQTNLVPVHICDVTVAEDHYYQQSMMSKLLTDFTALLEGLEDPTGAPESGSPSKQTPGRKEPEKMRNSADPWISPRFLSAWGRAKCYVLDPIYLATSWGAFSYSDLQPAAAAKTGGASRASLKKQVEKLMPKRLVGALPSIFLKLKQLDVPCGGPESTPEMRFESTLLCVFLLSGIVKPTASGVVQFESMLADVSAKLDASGRSESAFTSVMLQRCAEARIEAGLQTIFKYIDSSGDGSIDFEELNAVFMKARPNDTNLAGKLETLFGQIDEDGSGDITSLELARFVAKCNERPTDGMWSAVEERRCGPGTTGMMGMSSARVLPSHAQFKAAWPAWDPETTL